MSDNFEGLDYRGPTEGFTGRRGILFLFVCFRKVKVSYCCYATKGCPRGNLQPWAEHQTQNIELKEVTAGDTNLGDQCRVGSWDHRQPVFK